MYLHNCYYLEYSYFWLHSYFYSPDDMWFGFIQFSCFMSNSRVHKESQTEPIIWTTWVESSNSINHDRVQVSSYSYYFLLFLSVLGIEPATSKWFYSEAVSNQTPYTLRHVWQVSATIKMRSRCCIFNEETTITLLYKNTSLLFIAIKRSK